eukprot:989867-Rhodomonas_salina.6
MKVSITIPNSRANAGSGRPARSLSWCARGAPLVGAHHTGRARSTGTIMPRQKISTFQNSAIEFREGMPDVSPSIDFSG